jgi:hypothetical protein
MRDFHRPYALKPDQICMMGNHNPLSNIGVSPHPLASKDISGENLFLWVSYRFFLSYSPRFMI